MNLNWGKMAPEEAKLMQTQDLNYINYKRAIDAKRIEKRCF